MSDTHLQNNWSAKALFILIAYALLAQLIGHYFSYQWLREENFRGLWVLVRIIIPLALLPLIGIPLSKIFLGLPRFDKASAIAFGCSALVLGILFVYLNWFGDDYLSHYRRGQTLEQLQQQNRFTQFMVFTSSTMPGWEFLHRGVLLGGILFCLKNHMGTPEKTAIVIAILMVCIFEVLFHVKKPMYESFPFIPASIFLSWLTIRTQSLWPAMLIHFAIEVNFAFAAFVGV